MLAGVCSSSARAADDPDAQLVLALPRGFGEQAVRWRYLDTLADLEAPATQAEAAPLVAGVFDLGLRPFLPTPGASRPPRFVYAGRTLEEQRAAATWLWARNGLLSLGDCAAVEGVVRAIYGDGVQQIAISPPPRTLTTAVITGTLTLTGTQVVAATDQEVATGVRTYLLSSVNTDSNCPGNYVMGRVVNAAGIGVGGVAVQMVDQWGNKTVAFSKGGAESGSFDLPIYAGGERELSITVVDATGGAASPTIQLRYPPQESEAARCYHVVLRGES